MNNLSVIISAIVATTSVISPILTSIIDNMFRLKFKKIELNQKHYEDTIVYKRTILENYVKCTGRCIANHTPDTIKEYGQVYSLALVYAPADIRSKMIDLNKLIQSDNWLEAIESADELTILIAQTILSM